MGRDPRRRQQAAAKKKARREKRKPATTRAQDFGNGWRFDVSRSAVRNAPLHACLMTSELFEIGIGHVVIARRLPPGEIAVSCFLVDAQCLGVKDAFFSLQSSAKFDECVRKLGGVHKTREVEPAYARKLVERSVEFAGSIGFPPHEDYHDATVVFGDIKADDCMEDFTFGRDGKPCYVSGPYDSVQKRAMILATLRTYCGDGNYNYTVLVGENPPSDLLE